MIQTFSFTSSPGFGRRERAEGEKQKSVQKWANLMCKHYVLTLCAWVSWDYSAETTRNFSTYLGFRIWLHWKMKFRGEKEKKGKERDKGEGSRRWNTFSLGDRKYFFVRKVVHFWRLDTFFMLRCEAGLGSEFSLPEWFYECAGCSANSIWKHLGKQKRKLYKKSWFSRRSEYGITNEKRERLYVLVLKKVCVCHTH